MLPISIAIFFVLDLAYLAYCFLHFLTSGTVEHRMLENLLAQDCGPPRRQSVASTAAHIKRYESKLTDLKVG